MLVLVGPNYTATQPELDALVRVTGLMVYDIRTRLRPGAWSVVRVLAEKQQAESLAATLRAEGFEALALDSSICSDPTRRIVYPRGIELGATDLQLRLSERQMEIPLGALLTIVRGEVQVARLTRPTGSASTGSIHVPSSSSMRAVAPPGEEGGSQRDSRPPPMADAFPAADIHFATVNWVARVDPRDFEFPRSIEPSPNLSERLDQFVDALAARAELRVDRSLRVSSLASHTVAPQRSPTLGGAASSHSRSPTLGGAASSHSRRPSSVHDEVFDGYSRLVAEAERIRSSLSLPTQGRT